MVCKAALDRFGRVEPVFRLEKSQMLKLRESTFGFKPVFYSSFLLNLLVRCVASQCLHSEGSYCWKILPGIPLQRCHGTKLTTINHNRSHEIASVFWVTWKNVAAPFVHWSVVPEEAHVHTASSLLCQTAELLALQWCSVTRAPGVSLITGDQRDMSFTAAGTLFRPLRSSSSSNLKGHI